jgi:hypothetical protein
MSYNKINLFPLIIAVAILSFVGWYGYGKYGELTTVQALLTQTDETLFQLEQERSDVEQDYQDAKKDFVDMVSASEEKIATVFPMEEDLTSLTRAFDDFAFEHHYDTNPFFISQLSYGEVDDSDNDVYRILPITMTLETSERNFDQFLEYIETSGSLDNGIRLMSINAITLQLGSDNEENLRVQLSLSAYLQA